MHKCIKKYGKKINDINKNQNMKDTKKLCNREKSIKLCKWEIEQMDLKKIKKIKYSKRGNIRNISKEEKNKRIRKRTSIKWRKIEERYVKKKN